MNQKSPDPFGEFLNPKSMLTPGLAGAITMAITNALCSNFPLPRPHIALAISALLGILTVGVAAIPIWQKSVFGILNSLFIFAMAVGAATLGVAQNPPQITSAPSLHLPASSMSSIAYVREWGGDLPIPDGTMVKASGGESIPDGTIVTASGAERYLIQGGMRRLIPDDATFKAMGLKSENIKVIPDSQLQSIPLGNPLPSRRFFSPWFS
jgi:hypothetical protein